jgi:hypothetical protein
MPLTRIESELLIALAFLYVNECVYWIESHEQAFTRSSRNWKSHDTGPLTFTLLNRVPVLVDPLILRPGFVRKRYVGGIVSGNLEHVLGKVGRRLDELWLLEMQCRFQAMLLLLFLPWIIWTHRLTVLWQPIGLLLLISHILLMVSYGLALRRHAPKRVISIAAPVLFNPLGATRLLDAISQVLFDEELKRRSRGRSTSRMRHSQSCRKLVNSPKPPPPDPPPSPPPLPSPAPYPTPNPPSTLTSTRTPHPAAHPTAPYSHTA